jgi:hypothetical protein
VFSGTVRSNLDPFNEYGGDAYLWEAIRDCGLWEAVRSGRGAGRRRGVAWRPAGRAEPRHHWEKATRTGACRRHQAQAQHSTCDDSRPSPPQRTPLASRHAHRSRPLAASTAAWTAPAARPGPSASSSCCASRAPRSRRCGDTWVRLGSGAQAPTKTACASLGQLTPRACDEQPGNAGSKAAPMRAPSSPPSLPRPPAGPPPRRCLCCAWTRRPPRLTPTLRPTSWRSSRSSSPTAPPSLWRTASTPSSAATRVRGRGGGRARRVAGGWLLRVLRF